MSPKPRILLVEDEFITLDTLKDHLEASGYAVSGDAMRTEEAIEVLELYQTDLVILDINLKGHHDGIWLAEQIRQNYQLPFIFLTAYSDSATVKRAASTNPYGYLVKPFTQADLFSSIEVALKNYAKEARSIDLPDQSWLEGGELMIHQSIFIRDHASFKRIELAQIRYIQAYKNYIELNVPQQKITVRATLQKFITILPQNYFIQVHRSFVVNTKYVDEITTHHVRLGEDILPLSKSHKEEFISKFNFFV